MIRVVSSKLHVRHVRLFSRQSLSRPILLLPPFHYAVFNQSSSFIVAKTYHRFWVVLRRTCAVDHSRQGDRCIFFLWPPSQRAILSVRVRRRPSKGGVPSQRARTRQLRHVAFISCEVLFYCFSALNVFFSCGSAKGSPRVQNGNLDRKKHDFGIPICKHWQQAGVAAPRLSRPTPPLQRPALTFRPRPSLKRYSSSR